MAQINPKLNLNKTPSVVDNNSLIFAKNIRLDVDTTIHKDYSIMPISYCDKKDIPNKKILYDFLVDRIVRDCDYAVDIVGNYAITVKNAISYCDGKTHEIEGNNSKQVYKDGSFTIIGTISNNNEYYIFVEAKKTYNYYDYNVSTTKPVAGYVRQEHYIIRYSEKQDLFIPCNCNWKWSGGTITGCVITNLRGDKILNIAEYSEEKDIPLKSINLNTSNYTDDESIYTQTPNIPITNLYFVDRFNFVIPNGVYQFFIRYKIRDNFYTNWFPASNEIFVGNNNDIITSFGTLKYTNTKKDSDNSFILSAEHLKINNEKNYINYQIGFILSHDDTIIARAWKHFNFNIKNINFDYDAKDAEEIEVTDLLQVTYGLYNVGNVTSFKNKLYISNYTETNFNEPSLQEAADKVRITLKTEESEGNTYDGNEVNTTQIAGQEVINGLKIDGTDTLFYGNNNIFYKILDSTAQSSNSISQNIQNALDNKSTINYQNSELYGISIINKITSLDESRIEIERRYTNSESESSKITYDKDYSDLTINKVTINGTESTINNVIPYIYTTPRYLNNSCIWINDTGKVSDNIVIKLTRKAKITITKIVPKQDPFKEDLDDQPVIPKAPQAGGGGGSQGNDIIIDTIEVDYDQTISISFKADIKKLAEISNSFLTEYTTLIPYQKYKFYIHFVKANGEITNGYYCSKAGELTAPYKAKCNSIIYPIFNNISIPINYVACFFSILHTENNVATLFNIKTNPNNILKESSCIDANMMLVPSNNRIHVVQETKETYSGKYYYSSDSSIPRYFGADGIIVFDKNQFEDGKLAYIVNNYSVSQSDNIELIKCTPYLNINNVEVKGYNNYTFDDYSKMNLLGYICAISPLDRERCIDYYSDGSGIYYKNISSDTFYLDELSKYNDAENYKKLSEFKLITSSIVYIYSNYNLNYVALSEEPKLNIKTFYNRSANDTGSVTEKQENQSSTIILRLLSSQIMSNIYELPSMYKSYTRKIYSVYTNDEKIRFDNTVRSSILYGDENKLNVIKFDPNDYYNIPTNKGIIVNLVGIGDAILVHTQDSIFKFSGSNNLQATNGEILTGETQPFDTGVSELFGSDYGFAGLQNKTDCIITENGYIFFDRDSRVIYMYSGQGQITKLSDSIEKLFNSRPISNVYFANDYYNNRFFISILFYEYNSSGNIVYYPATLSFNFSENIKSFVSLHDFYFTYAFNTKTNCYFLNNKRTNIYYVDKNLFGIYSGLGFNNDNIYINSKGITVLNVDYYGHSSLNKPSYTVFNSIIDVIYNENYEQIKTLNSISWCSNFIKNDFKFIDNENLDTLNMAESILYINKPCDEFRVYSDNSLSINNVFKSKSNNYEINELNSYKLPRFNQGIWSFNYFRNIKNSNDNISQYVSDQNSLIEGKYFVARFVFNSEFKFETITFNVNNKI